MVARTSRRLPGFRFEMQSPPLTDVLPRMDVAVFVGFASSGPLHRPVAVEDVAQFRAIFGDDAPLAWDKQRNEEVYAYLAPTVRTFFRNGGRRCWIIRVAASTAQYNYFPIPGLVGIDADGHMKPAFIRARSEGSWSDTWQVSSALQSTPVTVTSVASDGLSLELILDSPNDVIVGDLLQLAFPGTQANLFFFVQSQQVLEPETSDSPPSPPSGMNGRNRVHVSSTSTSVFWAISIALPSPLPTVTQAVMFDHSGQETPFAVAQLIQENTEPLTIELSGINLAQAPAVGSLMRIDFKAFPSIWVQVQEVSERRTDTALASPPGNTVSIRGQQTSQLQSLHASITSPPSSAELHTPITSPPSSAERLLFELWARQGDDYPVRFSNLSFASTHPRFWNALPIDDLLFQVVDATGAATPPSQWQAKRDPLYDTLWHEAAVPRFPLAGSINDTTLRDTTPYLPISIAVIPEQYLGPESAILRTLPLERDGLQDFNASLFLDADLVPVYTTDLVNTADFLRYQSDQPRQLMGIHAALSIEEATIIAVPDAVHRGWKSDEQPTVSPPQSTPLTRPQWWHFLDCMASPPIKPSAVAEPKWDHFLDCDIRVLQPPQLFILNDADEHGTFTLGWTTISDPGARYTLQEATVADEREFEAVYSGPLHNITIYGRAHGNYYYRVRVEVGANMSDWSQGIVVQVNAQERYRLLDISDYIPDALFDIQRALVRMCAARGDLCAILTLPAHYHEDDIVSHTTTLRAMTQAPKKYSELSSTRVPPFNGGELRALSYAALYHPWVVSQDDTNPTNLQNIPADGPIAGIWARRALARGAWIAPANEPLSGIVALTPGIGRTQWQRIQDGQINLLRQEPRGFLTLSADTLSDDDDSDLRPINVRRLLILLRRTALLLGASYVFEPNSDAFRRMVQRGFEQMLEQMFIRGAFAGPTPDSSYQVVTDSSLNTPRSVDQGRFIVELRVAPSLPMTFLTIRLLQEGANGSVTEGK